MPDNHEDKERLTTWAQRTLVELRALQPTRLKVWELADSLLPAAKMHQYYESVLTDLATEILSVKAGYNISDDNLISSQLQEWWEESIPSDGVAAIMGEKDSFMDTGLCWSEMVNLSGEACEYVGSEVRRLRDIIGIAYGDYITDDGVRVFYTAWRQNFFDRVATEASVIAPLSST